MPAYNNYFPIGYQPGSYSYIQPTPTVTQPMAQPTVTTQPQSAGIVWVQGEAGAKAYPVAAGNSMLLMDSEGEQFYIKSTDISGMPMPLRVFTYKESVEAETENKKNVDLSNYITRDELEARLSSFKPTVNKKGKKEEIEDE